MALRRMGNEYRPQSSKVTSHANAVSKKANSVLMLCSLQVKAVISHPICEKKNI